ncbi:MAG: type I-B CRISPR-associated protein Cas7/Cst2/DevR, partial [Planctomycetota bacterium]
ADILLTLPYLFGGAKQTLHLTDVTPKILILTAIEGGNHLFMNITSQDKEGNPILHKQALQEVLEDYQDRLLSHVYIGHQSGFMDELKKEWENFSPHLGEKKIIHSTPAKIVKAFVEKELDRLLEE